MHKSILLLVVVIILPGCNSIPLIDLTMQSKCVTEVAKKSKLTCDFEGKKVFAKK